MKTPRFPAPALALALASLAHPLQADRAPNLVVNGDFESGSGPSFAETPPWFNRGAGSNAKAPARSSEGRIIAGAFSAVINDRFDQSKGGAGAILHAQNTGYVIEAGDAFHISYDWLPADTYWQRSRDTVRFVLYATSDDRMLGPVVWASTLTSGFHTGNLQTPKTVLEVTEVVTPAAVGRKLFVSFHGVDTAPARSEAVHWARVDNIVVTRERAGAPTQK